MGARRAAVVILAALLPLLTGCGGEPPEGAGAGSEPSPTPTTLHWRELGTWSGRGDRQTESFEIASGALRLTWSMGGQDGSGGGSLRVSLYSAISGRPLETIVEHRGPGADTVRLTAGPRVAYLLIEASGGGWEVGLQEGVAARER